MSSTTSPFFSGSFPITQGYRPGAGAFEPEHTGIDIGMPLDTVLRAPGGGTLEEIRNQGGFGNEEIFHPSGLPNVRIILGHLDRFLRGPGVVHKGDPIGLSGSTGFSTGPHLHFEEDVRSGGRWHDVNPLHALTGHDYGVGGLDLNPFDIGKGLSDHNIDLNPLDAPKGVADHVFKPFADALTGWIPSPQKAGAFLTANVIGLAVAIVIIVVLLGSDSKGPVINLSTSTPAPRGDSAPAPTPTPAPKPAPRPAAVPTPAGEVPIVAAVP